MKSVPDRFYDGGDFNDIYLRQQTDSCLNDNSQREPTKLPGNTFQKLLDSLPHLPVHNVGCICEICIGTKICPKCKIRSMYLDRKRRIWVCLKCQGFDVVRDPTQDPPSSYNNDQAFKELEKFLRNRDSFEKQ
jgi:hypothetical protein